MVKIAVFRSLTRKQCHILFNNFLQKTIIDEENGWASNTIRKTKKRWPTIKLFFSKTLCMFPSSFIIFTCYPIRLLEEYLELIYCKSFVIWSQRTSMFYNDSNHCLICFWINSNCVSLYYFFTSFLVCWNSRLDFHITFLIIDKRLFPLYLSGIHCFEHSTSDCLP